jgi:hypothetical protein
MAYAKRRPFKPGLRQLSNKDAKVISWCIKNGISVCVIPPQTFGKGDGDFQIEIIIKGKSNLGPRFKKQEVLEKQIEYYYYYYDKYNKENK